MGWLRLAKFFSYWYMEKKRNQEWCGTQATSKILKIQFQIIWKSGKKSSTESLRLGWNSTPGNAVSLIKREQRCWDYIHVHGKSLGFQHSTPYHTLHEIGKIGESRRFLSPILRNNWTKPGTYLTDTARRPNGLDFRSKWRTAILVLLWTIWVSCRIPFGNFISPVNYQEDEDLI